MGGEGLLTYDVDNLGECESVLHFISVCLVQKDKLRREKVRTWVYNFVAITNIIL